MRGKDTAILFKVALTYFVDGVLRTAYNTVLVELIKGAGKPFKLIYFWDHGVICMVDRGFSTKYEVSIFETLSPFTP